MKIKGVSEAIACYLGWDVADIRENRYHYGPYRYLPLVRTI